MLRAEPRERSLMLGELCDAHPEHAAILRRRYTALEQIGMLDADKPKEPTQIGCRKQSVRGWYVSYSGSWSAGIASTSRGGSLSMRLQ